MVKQRLTERQKNRLARSQAARADQDRIGQVVTRHGRNVAIRDETDTLVLCHLRRHVGEPVCGDRVTWLPDAEGAGVVTSILARDTELARPSYSGQSKPLASNFDRMAIVLAPEPEPVRYLLDQYLVAAEWIGVEALIVLNKSDLPGEREWRAFRARFEDYDLIGYPLIDTSAEASHGLDVLAATLSGHTSVLVGQSGVGKSSITRGLVPDQDIQIGRLSATTGLGRHTTSTTTLYALPGGGSLIDSPGVRSFRLGRVDRETLERGFREFRRYLGQCRFSDCAHAGEPGCALHEAAASGAISATRLANFHHLLRIGKD